MKIIEFTKLNKLPFFTINDLKGLTDENPNSIRVSLVRAMEKEILIQIKRGVYTTKDFLQNLRDIEKMQYHEFISTVLRSPSYLSLEYVLTKYELLTEPSNTYTSITLKNTASYHNTFGTYSYKNMKQGLFLGYETHYFRKSPYMIATKAKALFDYLYFKRHNIDISGTTQPLEELRIRSELLTPNDFIELGKLSELTKSKSMTELISIIKDNYAHNSSPATDSHR